MTTAKERQNRTKNRVKGLLLIDENGDVGCASPATAIVAEAVVAVVVVVVSKSKRGEKKRLENSSRHFAGAGLCSF